jgi:hypothetical protein
MAISSGEAFRNLRFKIPEATLIRSEKEESATPSLTSARPVK